MYLKKKNVVVRYVASVDAIYTEFDVLLVILNRNKVLWRKVSRKCKKNRFRWVSIPVPHACEAYDLPIDLRNLL